MKYNLIVTAVIFSGFTGALLFKDGGLFIFFTVGLCSGDLLGYYRGTALRRKYTKITPKSFKWKDTTEKQRKASAVKSIEEKAEQLQIVCTYCGIDPTKENCKHGKKCSSKNKVCL